MLNSRAPNPSRKLSVMSSIQRTVLLLLLLVAGLASKELPSSGQLCLYVKRIDLTGFMGAEIASNETNSFATMPGLFAGKTTARSPLTDMTVYSELIYVQDNSEELFNSDHRSINRYVTYIKFETVLDSELNQVKFSFSFRNYIPKFINKNVYKPPKSS